MSTILIACACALLAMALAPRPAVTAPRAEGVARTANTILSLSVGDDLAVALGVDEASSSNGAAGRDAHASFQTGVTRSGSKDPQDVGSVHRRGDRSSHSGTERARHGRVTVPGLIAATIAEATAAIDVGSNKVAATSDAILSNVDLAGGLIGIDGLRSSSATAVGTKVSRVTRSIGIDRIELFDLGDLLARLGVDPFALACAAVEDVAAALGTDGAGACEQAAAARSAVAAAGVDIEAAESAARTATGGYDAGAVAGARDQAVSVACDPLDVVCRAQGTATLVSLASEYDIALSNPADFDTTRAEVVAALTALHARVAAAANDLGLLGDAARDAAGATCGAALGALDDAIEGISASDPGGVEETLRDARTAVRDACALIAGTIDTLLDTPLLTLEDVRISVKTIARPRDPIASVRARVGSLTVGLALPVAVPDTGDLAAAVDDVEAALGGVLEALDIDAPVPDVELFAVDKAKGKAHGTWFADASITTLRITLPAGRLSVGRPSDLAVLGDGPAGAMKASKAGKASAVSSPSVAASVGVFDAGSTYRSLRSDVRGEHDTRGRDRGTLPVTGVGDWAMLAGAVLLALFAWMRRAMHVVR